MVDNSLQDNMLDKTAHMLVDMQVPRVVLEVRLVLAVLGDLVVQVIQKVHSVLVHQRALLLQALRI